MPAVAYNSKTDVFSGELFLFLGDEPLAFATSAQLQVTLDTKDAANKMSGDWDVLLAGKKSYQITADSLITSLVGAKSADTIIDSIVAGTPFDFFFGSVTKVVTGDSVTFAKDLTKRNYTGTVLPTECTVKSDNGTIASCSSTFKGVGALVPVNAATGA